MHYSNYIKCNKPAVVVPPTPVVETAPQQVETRTTPENVVPLENIPSVNPDQVQLDIPVMAPPNPKVTNLVQNNPIVNKMEQILTNGNPITTMKLNKILGYMIDEAEGRLSEPETMLDEDEANTVMEYLIHLQDTYFENIPLTEQPSRLFVWNIPKQLYNAMCKAIEEEQPDIFNPMFYFYLSMTDYPGLAVAHYLHIMIDNGYDNIQTVKQLEQQYLSMVEEVDDDE